MTLEQATTMANKAVAKYLRNCTVKSVKLKEETTPGEAGSAKIALVCPVKNARKTAYLVEMGNGGVAFVYASCTIALGSPEQMME